MALIDILGGKVASQPVALQPGPVPASKNPPVGPLANVKASVEALPEGDVKKSLILLLHNADSVGIARKLFVNPTLREKIVQAAGARKPQTTNPDQNYDPDQHVSGLTEQEKTDLGELTGWSAEFKTFHWMKAQHENKTPKEIEQAKADDTFPGLNRNAFETLLRMN